MLKTNPNVYFYGEFGCLNYSILAHLEKLNPNFFISTKPDYFKLMKMKAPKIKYIDDGQFCNGGVGSGFGFTIENDYITKLELNGFISLKKFLRLDGNRCIQHLLPIKSPLLYDIGLQNEYISISFRNRTHETQRNLEISQWSKIIKTIRSISNLEIIAHGMSLDTIPSSVFGIKKAETIEESIAYINKSKVFIASMSGIAQFASNCSCPIIQIGDVSRHFIYDPFNKGCLAVTQDNFSEKTLSNFLKNK